MDQTMKLNLGHRFPDSFIFFFFLDVLSSMWDLSSLTRDQTHATCSGTRVLTTEPLGLPMEELLQQRPSSWNIKRLLLTKENQVSYVKKFRAFLPMGRCKRLGFLKSFL